MIRIGSVRSLQDLDHPAARELLALGAPDKAEGYRIRVDAGGVSIVGRDARGVLFGVGHLLRELRMSRYRHSPARRSRYLDRARVSAARTSVGLSRQD